MILLIDYLREIEGPSADKGMSCTHTSNNLKGFRNAKK